MRNVSLTFSFFFVVSLPLGALAAEKPANLRQLKRQAQIEVDKEMSGLKSLGERDVADVITFVVREGKVIPQTALPPGDFEFHTLTLKGMPGVAKAQVLGPHQVRVDKPIANKFVQFIYHDLSDPTQIGIHTQVIAGPDLVNVSQAIERPDESTLTVQLVEAAAEGPEAVNLYVQNVTDDAKTSYRIHIAAGSFAELCYAHTGEVDAYLRPVFRSLRQEAAVFAPDAKAAWEVLSDGWKPDPATGAAADAAMAKLGAESYQDREAALDDLRKLGEPAAVYLMRADRTRLSLEQATRVDLFLAPYRPLTEVEAKRRRTDPGFLIDALLCTDPELRRLAVDHLRQATGEPIEFDSTLEGEALSTAVDALRAKLVGPSTRAALPRVP